MNYKWKSYKLTVLADFQATLTRLTIPSEQYSRQFDDV